MLVDEEPLEDHSKELGAWLVNDLSVIKLMRASWMAL